MFWESPRKQRGSSKFVGRRFQVYVERHRSLVLQKVVGTFDGCVVVCHEDEGPICTTKGAWAVGKSHSTGKETGGVEKFQREELNPELYNGRRNLGRWFI